MGPSSPVSPPEVDSSLADLSGEIRHSATANVKEQLRFERHLLEQIRDKLARHHEIAAPDAPAARS